MAGRLFTIACEFRGGTYISQVRASDERDAVREWADLLRRQRPIKKVSTYIARRMSDRFDDDPPTALEGLSGVWCLVDLCGGDLVLTNIIESVQPANGS